MSQRKKTLFKNLPLVMLAFAASTNAAVFNIGEPEIKNGMNIQPLYIQSVRVEGSSQTSMDHSKMQMPAMQQDMQQGMHDHNNPSMHMGGQSKHHGAHNMEGDIHLEAAVKASASNDWGFPEGAWVPYLQIHYTVKKTFQNYETMGTLIPMAANDGPHYGNNVKLDGPGKYTVKFHVSPPDGSVFMRHFDKETGVDKWWDTFEIKRQFTYIGVGKKGGY